MLSGAPGDARILPSGDEVDLQVCRCVPKPPPGFGTGVSWGVGTKFTLIVSRIGSDGICVGCGNLLVCTINSKPRRSGSMHCTPIALILSSNEKRVMIAAVCPLTRPPFGNE